VAYSEELADRVRVALEGRDDVTEKKMFGGIAFMVGGSMACGIVGDALMARVAPDQFEVALSRPHARVMDFTGRPMTGFVYVDPAGLRTAAALKRWVDETVAFATSPEQVARQRKKAAKPRKAKPFPPARRRP
jgi:TfoX/Sxy family transcriptional regulator of competence genes